MEHHSKRQQLARQRVEKQRLAPFMRALRAIHSVTTPEAMDPEDLEKQRKGQELLGRLVAPMSGMMWEPFDLEGMNCAWIRPQRGYDRRKAILYCHGGGYTSGNLGYSRILGSKLAQVTGSQVMSFEYRLAPEDPYPAAVEDAVKAWDYLMYLGYGARDVIVAGDSAGGNLALVLTHRLRESNRRLPRALLLFSPWTDMTASGKSYQEREDMDPLLTLNYIHATRDAYARGRDFTDPDLSPLYADLSGFPPTLIQVGTNELLLSDSVRLRNRLLKANVPCRLEVWDKMWHVFQTFPMKKANEAMEHVAKFIMETL
ncbi:alpha/beta hydrolase [Pseudoflavonifractor phocaeensis]|uniref:alpha/beta hydrolase n=1 Tax=Pseudoflavonifractor phocaeensis TaxID=1870988 RepID=UPI00195B1C4A|nr:alpha/beta hydrolase [Pseudoflavonifractor phocaeensis]MBM6924730.1 alpha/beta hydrolase [Pseudoflavonifractor phocaeensis]